VPAALTKNKRLGVYARIMANRRFPDHLIRRIVHGTDLDPSPQSVSLEAGSWHPRRYVFDCEGSAVRRRLSWP
jgi:hypothetical protein